MALTHRFHRGLRTLALALLGLAIYEGYRWWEMERLNNAIRNGSIVQAKESLPAHGIFAQAYFHAQKGDREHAIALYKQAEAMPDATVARAAKYNRANLYLTKAMELNATDNQNLGLPLAELAKDTYRALLRTTPGYWDAKYNLERALRLVPDPDDGDDTELPPPQQSERAPTTMRGFTLGLP
jgi:mxaK protein